MRLEINMKLHNTGLCCLLQSGCCSKEAFLCVAYIQRKKDDAPLCAFHPHFLTPTEYKTICVHQHVSFPARFENLFFIHFFLPQFFVLLRKNDNY